MFSTYHNCRVFAKTPFDALNYDIAADHGHYVDEYTVIREMAIAIGGYYEYFNLGSYPRFSFTLVFIGRVSFFINVLFNTEEIYND